MQRAEVGVADEVDGEDERVADLDVVGVEEGASAQGVAVHAGQFDCAEHDCGCDVHRRKAHYTIIWYTTPMPWQERTET